MKGCLRRVKYSAAGGQQRGGGGGGGFTGFVDCVLYSGSHTHSAALCLSSTRKKVQTMNIINPLPTISVVGLTLT